MGLNTRSRYVHLIINDIPNFTKGIQGYALEQLQDWLSVNTDFYAYIYHQFDTKRSDNGVLIAKVPHTHIVFLLKKNGGINKEGQPVYKRFGTILKELNLCMKYSTDTMTISVAKDWIGNCRYLLHLDSLDKFAYSRNEVVTSDDEQYDNFIAHESEVLTTDRLYRIIEDCDYSLLLIMQKIGLDNYKKYRLVVKDICISRMKDLQR